MNRRSAQVNIYYAKTAQLYLEELSEVLYKKHYFSFTETAHAYVRSLVKDMEATIHLKYKRQAPSCFSKYGKNLWYVSYPRNKQTTWYFFFTRHMNETYVIRHITNNHVSGHLLEE